MFCATSVLGISWEHLNHPNLLVRSAYQFHVYFNVRIILQHLGILFSYEDGFSKIKNLFDKSAYHSIYYD